MITKLKTLVLYLLMSVGTFAQSEIKYEGETINRIDKDGKKYGVWKLFDKERGIMIVAKMENDAFVSNIEYYQNGKLMVSQDKDKNEYTFYAGAKTIHAKTIVENDAYKIVKDNGEAVDAEILAHFNEIARIKAVFYGAPNAMQNYLNNEMNKTTWDDSGKVKVAWKVDKNGWVQNVKVTTSENEKLNEEAIRIIEKMPRWQPGFEKGRFGATLLNTTLSFNNM